MSSYLVTRKGKVAGIEVEDCTFCEPYSWGQNMLSPPMTTGLSLVLLTLSWPCARKADTQGPTLQTSTMSPNFTQLFA